MNNKEKKELSTEEVIKLIKTNFNQYVHSLVVLSRAVKSCPIPQINEYLEKRLAQEPKWETKWNIVYSIVTNTDLPKCRFCNKQLPFSAIEEKKFYCSEECEKTDLSLKSAQAEQEAQKPHTLVDKIKSFFKKKK